ncbi:hypothetical protein C8Q80DRAFT_1222839 [Daedaleopsis nitida]|nr:hypothetical protein C8Q80DRAFT_1222839 [Daedaleopsis nitida]
MAVLATLGPRLDFSFDRADGSLDKYPLPDWREVCPGVLASGQLTENHPLVDTYLDVLARISPREPSVHPTSATFRALPTHPRGSPREITFWQAEHAGIAAWNTVANLIAQQFHLFPSPTSRLYAVELPKLSPVQQMSIFTLAALKVLNHPTHPAHLALWAKNTMLRTADTVDDVIHMKPCPIESRVGWIGKAENLWALRGLQSMYIPPEPKGMTLRKRRNAPVTLNAAELAEDHGEAPRVSTRKRTRTTRASQKAKDAEDAQAAAAAAEDVVPEADPEPEAEAEDEEETPSLLFAQGMGDLPPQRPPLAFPAPNPTLEFITRAVKEDLYSNSPVLQAIELMLGLNQPSTDIPLDADDLPPPPSEPVLAATASPTATRRSTRARRKPAPPGPCSLLSTPFSTLSPSPAPSPELAGLSQEGAARSRGSSTAVSDADYPSEEGTVVDVDADMELETPAKAKGKTSGKRKAALVDADDVVLAKSNVNANTHAKKASPARSKRARTDELARDVLGVATSPSGENAEPAREPEPEQPSVPAVKKRRTASSGAAGGKRKAARARA